MSLDKNKSEIVESFKNLLKKADEVQGIELKNKNNIEKSNDAPDIVKAKIKNERAIQNTKEISLLSNNERLGIKSIKRIPINHFEKRKKEHNSDEFEKY